MAKKAAPKKASAKKSAEAPFFLPFAELGREAKAKEKAREVASSAKPAEPAKTAKMAAAPKPARAASVEPAPAPVDAETFAIYMAGVRALEDTKTRIPTTASRIERAAQGPLPAVDPDAVARDDLRSLVTEGIRFEVSDDGTHIEGRRVDLDPRELRRLRRGAFSVDGRLDLHGMSATDARAAVDAFVKKRSAEGDRAVVIIHGKGTHSPRGIGILRGEIGAWLSEGRASRHVAAFTSATDDEGGGGALYVLLAR